MTAPLRWAIAGTGQISHSIILDLLRVEGSEVVSVYSRDPAKAEAFGRQHGIPSSTAEYDQLIGDAAVDVIYLATPFATHHALAAQAIRAGKHVLVEKPMAMSADEVEDLFDLAEERRVFLMEAMWMKFGPTFRAVIGALESGAIGEPRSLRAGFGFRFPDDGGSKWDPARSGGALLDQGIYPVTLAHAVFGTPEGIHVRGVRTDDGVDTSQHFTLEFSSGRFAQCSSSMIEYADPSASVSGTSGWMPLPAPFWATPTHIVHTGSPEKMFRNPDRVEAHWEGNGYIPMLREVVASIIGGFMEHPLHPREDTVEVFRTLDTLRHKIAESI